MKPTNMLQSTTAPITILVVADRDEVNRRIPAVNPEKYCILPGDSTARAMEILSGQYAAISAVILDLQHEGCDAKVFLQQISENPLLASVPVIAVSDSTDPDEESTLLELGASDYIPKPIREKVLLTRIQNLIRMRQAAMILDLVEKDELTSLYNPQAFQHRAKEYMALDPDADYDVIVTDFDKFKIIKAVYGEEKANELLRSLASFLAARITDGVCARHGSDRFVWIQKSMAPGSTEIEDLLADFKAVSPIPYATLRAGIYAHIDKGLSMTRVYDKALLALRSIKNHYSKLAAFYDGPVSQRHLREEVFEARFATAIHRNEFVVFYQPKFDPYSEKVVGAEALVRWQNPDGSYNMPGDFLSVFEANGMISQLDEYVFRVVCRQQRKWKSAGVELIPISVNLSRNSMHRENIAGIYADIAREYGIDPKYIPIEITETTATHSIEIKENAEALRRAGFPLHMDDFGSEHSSLHTLNVLNFDVVKLDKGLIDFIGDKNADVMLMYTMALGTELGLRIVAEGVETQEQLDFLIENKCDQIQGYLFSKPLPVDLFEQKVTDILDPGPDVIPIKEKKQILTLASHVEKIMVQRMLPRIPGGFLIYEDTPEERIVYSNAYLWKLFGCGSEEEFMEYVQGSFRGIVCPEDLDRVEQSIRCQLESDTDSMDQVEYTIITKNGQRIPVVDYGHLEQMKNSSLFYVFIYRK